MSQPPGNYWAQGDPPNTTRYWNGQTWEGGPVPHPNQNPVPQPSGAFVPRQSYPEDSQATMALIASLVGFMICAVGYPIGWYIGKREMDAIDAGRRDPSKRSDAKVAYYIGMVGTILVSLALVVGLVFIFVGVVVSAA